MAVTLTEDLTKLRRDGVPVETLDDQRLRNVFKLISEGAALKESLPDILTWLAKNPNKTAKEALNALELNLISHLELLEIVKKTVESNSQLIKDRGSRAKGTLMGFIMRDVRGRADASEVNKILEEALKEKLAD